MAKDTTYFERPDGSRVYYQHDKCFVPNGSLSVPFKVWDEVLPGAAIFEGGGQWTCEEPRPHVFRSENTAIFARQVQGPDKVWREEEGSRITCKWVVESDYTDLYADKEA